MKFEQASKERVSTKRHLQYHRKPNFLGTENLESEALEMNGEKNTDFITTESLIPHEQIARSARSKVRPRADKHNCLLVAILIFQIIHLLLNFYVWYSMACSICIDYLIGG